ncbi:MAG: guanylate kinase [Bacillota bacterium]
MLVLIGASASGKTEIAKLLIKHYGFEKMITYTTRQKRHNEINGVDYHFVDEPTFLKKAANHDFLETTIYNNTHYGTAFKDALPYRVVIVDIPGANALYHALKENVVIMYIETLESLRKDRMLKRGDQPEEIEKRLDLDKRAFDPTLADHIDYIIQNSQHSITAVTKDIAQKYKHMITK